MLEELNKGGYEDGKSEEYEDQERVFEDEAQFGVCGFGHCPDECEETQEIGRRSVGRVVRHGSAKPATAVQFRYRPPIGGIFRKWERGRL